MKRVLVYGMSANLGGVESVIMNYFQNIDESKVHFDFLCSTNTVAYEEEITKHNSKIFKINSRRENPSKFYRDLNNIFKSNNYDAIWVNVCSLANISYLKFAKKYGIKTRIIHAHNSQNMNSWARGILHKLNKLKIKKYATDFWSCDMSASRYFYPKSVIKSPKHKIVPNAINLEKYQFDSKIREQYRKDLNLTDKFVVGHIGRLHFQKNQTFLLDVFAKIAEKKPNSQLLLIGQGEDEAMLKNKCDKLGITSKVSFMGLRNDVEKLFSAFDVFVFPSVFEGLPVILIEAQASGIPILASDNISKNTKISDSMEFMSLNCSAEDWAKKVCELDINGNRTSITKKFYSSDFNIKNQTKNFEKLLEV